MAESTRVDGALPPLHSPELDIIPSETPSYQVGFQEREAVQSKSINDLDTHPLTPKFKAVVELMSKSRRGWHPLEEKAKRWVEAGRKIHDLSKETPRDFFVPLRNHHKITKGDWDLSICMYKFFGNNTSRDHLLKLGIAKLRRILSRKWSREKLSQLDENVSFYGCSLEELLGMTEREIDQLIKSSDRKAERESAEHVKESDAEPTGVVATLTKKDKVDLVQLQPGDRIESLHARRPGAVVKIYADESGCVCWDDGEPQEAGLGHERMPRNLLVKVASEAAPARGDVDAAFETPADTAAGDVNDGGSSPTAAPEAAPEAGAQAAPADNIRRVDAQLQVHWAGRVFDVARAGVGVGDDVMCQPAPIPPFLWVRKIDASQREHMATMVEPVEPPPLVAPQAAPPDPALTHRKLYLRERMKVLLRYTDGPELNDIEDLLDELVSDISRGRYVPGLVAADYELTRRFWIEGGAK